MRKGLEGKYLFGLLVVMVLLAGCSMKKEKYIHQGNVALEETDFVTEQHEAREKEQEKGCLRLYLGEISQEVSPFFYMTVGDDRLLSLLYTKVHQITVKKPTSENRHTIYQITIDENARDKDGNQLTADDLLYNYLLRCQTDYRGLDQINQMHIVGLEKYWYGVSGKELKGRKKKVKEKLSHPGKTIEKKLRQEVILPALKREYAWAEAVYLDKSQKKLTSRYPQVSMLFARYFAPDTNYTGKGKSKKQVLHDVAKQYKGDIKKLSRVTEEDYMAMANCVIIDYLWKRKKTAKDGIAGIRKTDDRTIEIVTEDFQKKDKERLENLYLVSSHEVSNQDSNSKFPVGCGMYYLEGETETDKWLASNNFFQEGSPNINGIQVIESVSERGENVSVECVKNIVEDKLDMAIVWERISSERTSLKKILQQDEASWRVAANGGVLYNTRRVNATTLSDKMTAQSDVLKQMGTLKLN